MPAPYVPDPKLLPEEQTALRVTIQKRRDNVFRTAAAARTARLQRVIDTVPLTLTESQKRLLDLRVQQIVYALLSTEFPITKESAPETVLELDATECPVAGDLSHFQKADPPLSGHDIGQRLAADRNAGHTGFGGRIELRKRDALRPWVAKLNQLCEVALQLLCRGLAV